MTEAEWLEREWCGPLFELLRLRGLDSERKLRLFGVACCLHNLDLFTDVRLVRGLDVAEKFADGGAVEREIIEAEAAVLDVFESELDVPSPDGGFGSDPIIFLLNRRQYTTVDAVSCAEQIEYTAEYNSRNSFSGIREELKHDHCDIVREIFGNPFRPAAFNPAWRTTDVVLLARGIYEEKAFDRMPILADALQDAGCDSDDLLAHCRDTSLTHARGCWVVDAVLGKA